MKHAGAGGSRGLVPETCAKQKGLQPDDLSPNRPQKPSAASAGSPAQERISKLCVSVENSTRRTTRALFSSG
jgi:hypothetical protein